MHGPQVQRRIHLGARIARKFNGRKNGPQFITLAILVPLLFNDGTPVPESLLAQTFEELRAQFSL